MRTKPQDIIINLEGPEIAYLRITAFNRFLDNVEKALRGDAECKANLLGEDLQDARRYYQPVFNKIRNEID